MIEFRNKSTNSPIEVTSTLMSKQGSNSELFAHENDALTARPHCKIKFVKS